MLGINTKAIMVSFNHNINITSREINLNGIGSYSIELVNINSQNIPELHEFGVNLSNICVDRKNHIFSKILRISPRYIFVNRTPFDIQIRQEGCFKSSLLVCPELRIPFFWNENSKKYINKLNLYYNI